jgi:ACT domain-containing protein
MVIELKANLPDIPGALIKMLKPISDNAGNISSVIHMHEELRGEKVPVIVRFDLPENSIDEKLETILEELRNLEIEVSDVTNLGVKQETVSVIMTGHVFQTDFVDTFRRLSEVGAHVIRIEAMFKELNDISNVKFELHVDKTSVRQTMDELRAISVEKNLSMIFDR